MAEQLNLFSSLGFEAPEPEPPPPPDKETQLKAIAEVCAVCTICELHTGRTHSVFSDGNPDAKVMLIGEGPGRHEDESGVPFVGRAGQLLNKIFESVGFNRQKDLYICNIVKCRPPNNRTPTPKEMEACFPYLDQQLELVKPEIIILAGSTAIKGLLKDQRSVTKIRGQWQKWRGIDVMPIFHPAYLLRNDSREVGSPKWLTWQDMKAIRERYEALQLTT